jgi:hypothetical protein
VLNFILVVVGDIWTEKGLDKVENKTGGSLELFKIALPFGTFCEF